MSKRVAFVIFNLFAGVLVKAQQDSIKLLENELVLLADKEKALLNELERIKLEMLRTQMKKYGYPEYSNCSQIIEHSAMTLCYDKEHKQSRWVYHAISPDVEFGKETRTNDFRADPKIKEGHAKKEDYWHSGYDRGHMAPSADFRWSKKALSESFYYSNMSPQKPELNREIWAELEDMIRDYAVNNNRNVYVVTGPLLKKELQTIGENKVSVPEYYYKVIADLDGDTLRGIGFIMPNQKCRYPVLYYAVTIDSVEKVTQINFFSALIGDKEKAVESVFILSPWQSVKEKGNVLPVNPQLLPKGRYNTVQAKYHVGETACVCGTVVATKYSEKSGHTFINLDQKFPNQLFSISISKTARKNFSYIPENHLQGKTICVSGKISDNKGTPEIKANNEKSILIIENENFNE